MKKQLEIGDEIKRFEVMMSREIAYTYIIDTITKTLAKSGDTAFKKELIYETIKPKNSSKKIIARVYRKSKDLWCDYFLVEK